MAAVFVAGCDRKEEEEKSPFAGGDNSIVAFTLVKNGVTLKAAIISDALVITAPERFSLEGAAATVTLSENATIAPDPAAITDWDAAQTFTVTACNGAKSTYAYSVERNIVSRDGDVTLLTQADVDAFAADPDAEQIKGVLTVGVDAGQDTVYSLAPLAGKLKVITGGITVNATYAGEDLAGLSDNIEKTGDLTIRSKKLKTVSFPKLAAVRLDMNIDQATLVGTLDFPELTTVDKGLRIYYADSLETLNFPKLQQVIENVLVQGRSSGAQNLQAFELPALQTVGGSFTLSYWREATAVSLPELTSVDGAFAVTYINKAEHIAAPKLESVASFTLNNCAVLTEIDFRAVETSGAISVSSCAALPEIAFPALTTASTSITLSSCAALSGIDFSAVETANTISVSSCAALTEIAFPALKTVSATMSVGTCAALAKVNFPVLETVATISMSSCAALAEINCPVLETVGTLTLPPSTVLASVRFPRLTSVTANLTVANVAARADLQFPLLKTVGNTFRIQSAALTSLDAFAAVEAVGALNLDGAALAKVNFPALETVATISMSNCAALDEINFPELETVETLTLPPSTVLASVRFPRLTSVTANLTVANVAAQANLQFPLLKTVGNTFRIQSATLTSLDAFAAVETVGVLNLDGAAALTSLNGLSSLNSVKTLTATGLTSLTEIDLRRIKPDRLELSGTTAAGLTLTGDELFPGALYIASPPSGTANLSMTVQGIKTVGALQVAASYYTAIDLPWLEHVTELIYFSSGAAIQTINLPNLESTGGLQIANCAALTALNLPRLKTITGYTNASGALAGGFTCAVTSSNITALTFPVLESVTGSVSITGLTAARKLETIGFPALQSLTGTLAITGTSNATFKDLSGFSALTSAGGVEIRNFTQLKDFEPLKNVIPSLAAGKWTVTGCGYNPSYQQMEEGAYSNE
jgi:hypothetical protein